METIAAIFWVSVGLLLYAQLGYPAALLLASRLRAASTAPPPPTQAPSVSLIVAAHDEQAVIAAKVANALSLAWPRERLELLVCADGCSDATAARAREAGADIVLELPRVGKVRAQDAGVAASNGELLAFSDANASWEPDALARLAAAFADPSVGYACGQVRFVQAGAGPSADNQEGLYWRYEMAIRAMESRLRSVTAGNGAIYATRRESYLIVDPRMGHDLAFPFKLVKRGWRAVYVADARATERMVPSIDGEFARKRRMMGHAWPIILRGGMLGPRGYGPLYAWMIASHRLLRYGAGALHVIALACNLVLLGHGAIYLACLLAQLLLLTGALLAGALRLRPLLIARYYVLMQASIALGLWDYLRHGTAAGWEAAEGTR